MIHISVAAPTRRIGRTYWELVEHLDSELRELSSMRITRDREPHEPSVPGDVLTPALVGLHLNGVVQDYVYAGVVSYDEAREVRGFIAVYLTELRYELAFSGVDR
jgi:hypothetical protein